MRDHVLRHLQEPETAARGIELALINKSKTRSLRELLPPARPRGRDRVRASAVGIVSSPQCRPTLDAVADSLIRAGWTDPYLFLDGTEHFQERHAHLPGVLREPRIGCWPNYQLAPAELLVRHPDADALLLTEDDALICDSENVRGYLEQMLWPTRGPCLVSLYGPGPYSSRDFGWKSLRSRWTGGALAFVFLRRIAQEIVLDLVICNHHGGW